MQFRNRIEAFLALQAKDESERTVKAALLSLYDAGLIEFKWDDNGELLSRRICWPYCRRREAR
jgi:DNA-binding transcriptional ArsR family regulator